MTVRSRPVGDRGSSTNAGPDASSASGPEPESTSTAVDRLKRALPTGSGRSPIDTDRIDEGVDTLKHRLRVACFWAAVALPALHVPLLASGLTTGAETTSFLVLVGCNVLALVVGHSHRS